MMMGDNEFSANEVVNKLENKEIEKILTLLVMRMRLNWYQEISLNLEKQKNSNPRSCQNYWKF